MVIKEVQSLCPVCHEPVRACYVTEKGQVFLRKTCSAHGKFESIVADQEGLFLEWIQNESINIPPKKAITPGNDCFHRLRCEASSCLDRIEVDK